LIHQAKLDEEKAMSNGTWQFCVDDLPDAERQKAWGDVMRRLRLPLSDFSASSISHGIVRVLGMPMGGELAVISSGPQVFAGRSDNALPGIWLGVLLDGKAEMETQSSGATVNSEAILFGATGVDATLRLNTNFTMVLARLPEVAISSRLIAPLGRRVGILGGHLGLEPIFRCLIVEAARNISGLTPEMAQPLELALIEFLVACLASGRETEARGGALGARASYLRRICQKIELQLPDPNLSLPQVAAANGVSPRYLQKLFTQNHQTFGAYIKQRRLDRCHADLLSPIHAQLSISEICFRWGFNDAAHFSRSFRQHFGLSPREHRQAGMAPGP
jgi:AraC-like DNA-binding protein